MILWIAILFNLASGGMNVWYMVRNHKAHKRMNDASKRLTPSAVTEEMAKSMHRYAMIQLGLDVDFLERINNDLLWLHEQIYKQDDPKHTCPVCDRTGPEIDDLIEKIKGLKFEVRLDKREDE